MNVIIAHLIFLNRSFSCNDNSLLIAKGLISAKGGRVSRKEHKSKHEGKPD